MSSEPKVMTCKETSVECKQIEFGARKLHSSASKSSAGASKSNFCELTRINPPIRTGVVPPFRSIGQFSNIVYADESLLWHNKNIGY